MSLDFVKGMVVRYRPRSDWGPGRLMDLEVGEARARILFAGRTEPTLVSTKGDLLLHHVFEPGEQVLVDNRDGTFEVVRNLGRARGRRLLRYEVRARGADPSSSTFARPGPGEDSFSSEKDCSSFFEVTETDLQAVLPSPDLVESLREGRVGDATAFLLRKEALRLDDERRADAMGALFASRVTPLPYQVGVVQRVLAAPRPRFILADEVGLGKTIEAGMVFSALWLSGLAQRVLVVAPQHLTVQWLVELAHKFNHLFTLMDGDRYAKELASSGGASPWCTHNHIVTSLELLSRDEKHRSSVGSKEAAWDLVIIDEAHHLRGRRAFEAAEALSANTNALLLLTATPMQLDPDEYHRLLCLIDPDTAPTLEQLKKRMALQEEISSAANELLSDRCDPGALSRLACQFRADPILAAAEREAAEVASQPKRKRELLTHIAETYSLSDHLLRNRRGAVGGFTERRLHRHAFEVPEDERREREAMLRLLVESTSFKGAVLFKMLRHLESSPAALKSALSAVEGASGPLLDVTDHTAIDAKCLRLLDVVESIRADEPGAKILIFTEARATLDWLLTILGRRGISALGYHGELSLVERDRRVARFRDPEGPAVLISTEVGGEGRNFQFCHHIVHYDLPFSPAAVEQRIGRVDRIGQRMPVDIHVFEPMGTLSADVVSIMDEAVGVFRETVGGLDAVLEEVEPSLLELALRPAEDRRLFKEELSKKVAAARTQVKRAYDPLLDLRSCNGTAIAALAKRTATRLGLEFDDMAADQTIRDTLWTAARDLDERLEESITEIAARIGIGVDLDEHVEAFQCAFHFGHALKVDALPGIDITKEQTILGTFWRDTAIQHEEIEYFATGNEVVEALLGFLRDGPFGRAGFRLIGSPEAFRAAEAAKGLELIYHLEDTRPGPGSGRADALKVGRFLDDRLLRVVVLRDRDGAPIAFAPGQDSSTRAAFEGVPSPVAEALARLDDEEGLTVRGDEIGVVFPDFGIFVDEALAEGSRLVETILKARVDEAQERLVAERSKVLSRLELSMHHQQLPDTAREKRTKAAETYYEDLLDALLATRPVLDSACGFVAANETKRRVPLRR